MNKGFMVLMILLVSTMAFAKKPPETHREEWSSIDSSVIYESPHTRWFIAGWWSKENADKRMNAISEALEHIYDMNNVSISNNPRLDKLEFIHDRLYQHFHRENLIAIRIAIYTETALRIKKGGITVKYPSGDVVDHGVFRIDENSDYPYDRDALHVIGKRDKQPTYLYILVPDSYLSQRFECVTFDGKK